MALLHVASTRRPGRSGYALGAALSLFITGLAAACSAPGGADPPSGPASGNGALPAHLAACLPACSAPSDCVPPQGPALYDASHYACNAGLCEWKGCASDTECSDAYQSTKLVCAKDQGAPVAACVPSCTTAADCVNGKSSALNDAAHYTCNGGICDWKGCQSNAECDSAYPGGHLRCAKPEGSPIAACLPSCTTAADCSQGGNGAPALYSASHYQCNSGLCQWTGCTSNAECASAYPGVKVVCK